MQKILRARKPEQAMPGKNNRPLEDITADIYKCERQNIFDIGNLLREAKAQLPHGRWLPYLQSIGWGKRSAQLHMAVAELANKYASVAHLNAAPTALYQLVWLDENHPDAMPLAIERLKKSIERKDSAAEQREDVLLSIGAKNAEDAGYKDITELALKASSAAINQNCFGIPERMKAMQVQSAAIIKANPKTDEELKAVLEKNPVPLPADIARMYASDEEIAERDKDAETTSLVEQFDAACEELLMLSSKPSAVFADSSITHGDLDMLGNFLKQIAASKKMAAST